MMKKEHKENLKNITFCIPIRIESFYRIQNIKALLKYLDKYLDTNYLILEADKTKHFENDMNIQNVDYLFVEDNDIIFHRTKYINQMLNQVQTTYAAVWDTDAITPICQIVEAYSLLQNSNNTLIYPFSGFFIALNELTSLYFYRSQNINHIASLYYPVSFPYGFYSVGGAYMVNRKMYLEAGGENEYFHGWGPEDAERNARIQILELGVDKIEGPLFHLFHTRGINSRYPEEEGAGKNINEFCKVCGMTTIELQDYIETWDWRKANKK